MHVIPTKNNKRRVTRTATVDAITMRRIGRSSVMKRNKMSVLILGLQMAELAGLKLGFCGGKPISMQ